MKNFFLKIGQTIENICDCQSLQVFIRLKHLFKKWYMYVCDYFRQVESNVRMFLLRLCLCLTRVEYLSGFVEFLSLKPIRSTRHGWFDGEGGTLKCFHV